MGSGASRWRWSRHKVEQAADAVVEEMHVDPKRYIPADQEIIVSGDLWKLNHGADPSVPREWLKRWMWLTDTGGFFYYSRQFHKPMGCYVARLTVNAPDTPVLGRYVLELAAASELGVKPTLLACETKEDRDLWVRCVRSVQDVERKLGEDNISPLEPFCGSGIHTDRPRLSFSGYTGSASSSPSEYRKQASMELLELRGHVNSVTTSSSSSSARSSIPVGHQKSYGDTLLTHCSSLVQPKSPIGHTGSMTGSMASCIFSSPVFMHRGGVPMKMRHTLRRNSQEKFVLKGQTVLILDWDDTLFPTTFIRKDCKLDWRLPVATQVRPGPGRAQVEELLDKLSERVEAFLELACSAAQVVVVTLAASPWVATSSQNFMPRLGRSLQEHHIEVIYAREKISEGLRQDYASDAFHSSADEASYWMRAKALAMQEVIEKLYGASDSSWKNVISIGDSDFERVALSTVANEHFRNRTKNGQMLESGVTRMAIASDGHLIRLRTKTVKLLDEPSVEELIAQVSLLQSWLPHIVSKDAGMDVDLMGSQDDQYLTEVHRQVTGTNEVMRWRELASIP